MARDWKTLISKTALCVGMLCVLGTTLGQVRMVRAESSEPTVVAAPPIEPVTTYAQACYQLLTLAASCVSTPMSGTGACQQAWQNYAECQAKLAPLYNEYAAQAGNYWYQRSKKIQQGWEFKLKLAVIGGVLDMLGMMAQRVAYETAQLILTGGDSEEPMFWNQNFGEWLSNTADQASSEFLYSLDNYVKEYAQGSPFAGMSICTPPNALNIKMSLGMGRLAMLAPRGHCTLSQLANNFEAIADMVESGDAIAMQRPQFTEGGPANDLSTTLQINNAYLNYVYKTTAGAQLQRIESEGMKPVMDKITGRLQYPSMLANESMRNMDPVLMANQKESQQQDYMVQAFWEAGIESIGFIALKVFINTMALGILHKIFDPKTPSGAGVGASPEQMTIKYEALKNEDASGEAQNLFERQDFAKALGDFITPNYGVTEDQDMTAQMSSCAEPRTRWNCSMDQNLATAINVATQDGALTVGKASGLAGAGSKSPIATGLHPDWELIPESDLKNNTDPACYQRAYCAGNLKKLRLARIISVGWEMAANSPYNNKADGKYVTLGEVIRGFYDCNDQGQLDKDHPWCHLIDPNWILVSPKYQCRAKGFGDALVPELGTRLEECGDMVSCLSANQKGECTGGYGYCLAERPVYRFDARDCDAQYASCRTWTKSDGNQLSALRNTVERGNCSEDNVGCMWYATQRYVTSTASADGLWVGTATTGPRVYWDKNVQPCTAEGCTKVMRVAQGQSALNLVGNGSFEQTWDKEVNGSTVRYGFKNWSLQQGAQNCQDVEQAIAGQTADGNVAVNLTQGNTCAAVTKMTQWVETLKPGRNYMLTVNARGGQATNNAVEIGFFRLVNGSEQKLNATVTSYEDCAWDNATKSLKFTKKQVGTEWAPQYCQFVTPKDATMALLTLGATAQGIVYDAIQLEEGEFSNPFVDGVAPDLETAHLKVPPDEYACSGNDMLDNPACKRFARMCRQTDVGCQGYTDLEDPSAPEIPATVSTKDLCPAVCAGYGQYQKLASTFDLVRNTDPRLDDPEDKSVDYFIPDLAPSCTLSDVGCEAFTSMESATSTGENVSYFNDLRYCQKPNDKSTTYYTWEGSDASGYQLVTWALIRDDIEKAPKIMLTGGLLGTIKDPANCDENAWKGGADPDCRQFYDEQGVAYYRYYSQTVSSDRACTKLRKDDSTSADCTKTGGTEYIPQTKSCIYDALPSQSASCPASAGGCRAYLGPTGRNAANVFNEAFTATSSLGWFSAAQGTMNLSLSKEAVLVGDKSLKMEPMPANAEINASMALTLPTTSTLYRVSFWAKAASNTSATLTIDGQAVGQFKLDPRWKRYEFGPFYAKGTAQQATQQVQKHCGKFAFTPNQALINSIKTQNPGMDDPTALAQALATVTTLWNDPAIPKNYAALSGKTCTDDTQCKNLSVFAADGTTVQGTVSDGKCGFAGVTAAVVWHAPADSKAIYIDTLRVDQLNDVQFVRKGLWSIPAACDATYPEGVPQARAMLGCRAYKDRDNNTLFVRNFGNLCNADAIGCKAFVDTRDMPNPYAETLTIKGTPPPSKRVDGLARKYEEQYLGDWSVSSPEYRYLYAIDDDRGRCDSGEAMCRAYGKPVFQQNRLELATTTFAVDPNNADIFAKQQMVQQFQTVLMKDDWNSYVDDNGDPKLACRKDELFCDRYQSGNVTEFFRDPGNHACVWQKSKKLEKNEAQGIPSAGEYGGWFREGTDIPCYPGYQKNGDSFGAYYSGEDPYSGWVSKCPADQSECTEFVDPNDLSDPAMPNGRAYYLIQSSKLDTRTCGGTVDPLAGCVLFNNKNVSTLEASSKATYDKVSKEKGAAQSPLNCETDKDNPYCITPKTCHNLKQLSCQSNGCSLDMPGPVGSGPLFIKEHMGKACQTDADCSFSNFSPDGYEVSGECSTDVLANDANIILKVKLDRECSRWMGCRTGETVFDPTQQKYVNQCSQLQLCQKNGSNSDDIFCAQFTDRGTEDLLKPGQFMDSASYSTRKVGFGAMDYSGLSAPDQYLVADIVPHNVGADLTAGTGLYGRYRLDQRLVARVPIGTGWVMKTTDPKFNNLDLCKDVRTNRYGYISSDGKYCYLSIAESTSLSQGAGGSQGGDVTRDIQRLYDEFKDQNVSRRNSILQSAMPEAECQLYPEADAPLPNEYVAEWNSKVTPPMPKQMQPGYENAKSCVYGEDCSCSYRKARYQAGGFRYYSTDGSAPSVGVCVGGNSDGQPCVPGGYVPVDAKNKVLIQTKGTANPNAGCDGGMCSTIQDVVVQNGRYGYCLERDKTRVSDVTQSLAPCLTWAPQAVLGGKRDTTHYSPTAGYLPPQGSGEYYCVSGANEQRLFTPSTRTDMAGNGKKYGAYFVAPGYLPDLIFSRYYVAYQTKYAYPDMTGKSFSSDDATVYGAQTQNMMFACRRTSRCEGYHMDNFLADNKESNTAEGRWIQTGASFDQSYMEYFIPYIRQTDKGPGVQYALDEASYDFRFGLFKFSIKPYAAGSACKWNLNWMGMSYPSIEKPKTTPAQNGQPAETDFSCQNYLSNISSLSQQFYSGFTGAFPGILDRQSEKILTDPQGKPVRLGCVDNPDEKPLAGFGSTQCYFKYWQTGFQYNSQEAFTWPDKYSQSNPDSKQTFNFWKQTLARNFVAKQCQSDKPYFAIRAVFQNVNTVENSMQPDDAAARKLNGPWQFVGFWFSTCMPSNKLVDNPGWLYMQLDIVTADVCREVGRVIAPYTRESAVFADRVWANGQFVLPVLGIQYSTRNQPYGSAISTGEIGHVPMVLGASVPMAAQTGDGGFVDSGVGIQPLFMTQQNTWAPLSNLFARIYKIYRWESSLVNKADWVCVGGANQGKNCTPKGKAWPNHYDAIKTCTGYATCDTNLDKDVKNQNWRCNTLSGVNRGLRCGEMETPRNLDTVCHNSAVSMPLDPTDDVKDPALQKRVQVDLYGSCQETGYTDFYLSASDLGMLGFCKKADANNCKTYLTDDPTIPYNTSQNYNSGCIAAKNSQDTSEGLCTPLIDRVYSNIGNRTSWGQQPTKPANYSSCLYSEMDDLDANSPKMRFKYAQCPNEKDSYYIYPVPDGLEGLMQTGSGDKIARRSQVLAIIYGSLKLAAKDACTNKVVTELSDKVNELRWNHSGYYDANYVKQWIADNVAVDFPNLAGKTLDQDLVNSVSRYWNLYGMHRVKYYCYNDDRMTSLGLDSMPLKVHANMGPVNYGQINTIAINTCSDSTDAQGQPVPVVNPGARCDMGNYDPDVGGYRDCPVKIEACTAGVKPGADTNTTAFYRTITKQSSALQTINLRVPKCGFCTKGQGSPYEDSDPYRFDKSFQDTGYCYGFNPLSRCNTNSDCRFTSYEYWGAYDKGKAEGVRFGTTNPYAIYADKDANENKTPWGAPVAATRHLPTPLFDDGNGGAMTEVPAEYSKPSILSPAGHDTGLVDINFRGGDCQSNGGDTWCADKVWRKNNMDYFGIMYMCDDQEDCGTNGDVWECEQCGFNRKGDGEYPINEALNKPPDYPYSQGNIGQYLCPIEPWNNVCRYITNVRGAAYDADDGAFDTNYVAWAAKSAWIQITYYCYMSCNAAALQFPNSYAYNFEKIVKDNNASNAQNVQSGGKKQYRMAAVAPFAINPLYRTLQSLGLSVYWEKFSKDDEDKDPARIGDVIGFAQGELRSAVDNSPSSKMDLSGLMFTVMNYQYENNTVFDWSGDLGRYYQYNYFVHALKGYLGGDFHLNQMLASPFVVDGILGGNGSFPWDPAKVYGQGVFPLATGGYEDTVTLQPNTSNYLSYATYYALGFFQYSNFWRGYGVPQSIIDATQKILSALDGYNGPSLTPDSVGAQKRKEAFEAYVKAYRSGMRDEFFDKTGWGTFMDPSDARLKLYPGAMLVAVPNPDTANRPSAVGKPYNVYLPGHCEPPPGGTDTDTVSGELKSIYTVEKRNASLGMPLSEGTSFVKSFSNPWASIEELINKWKDNANIQTYTKDGIVSPDNYQWIPSYVKVTNSPNDVELPGPSDPTANALRSTCRCIGGTLDGQVVEAEFQCNPRVSPTDDPLNFDPSSNKVDWQYCKPATMPDDGDSYINAISQYVGQDVVDKNGNKILGKDADGNIGPISTGVTQAYINDFKNGGVVGKDPIPECRQGYGLPDSPNPDEDDNACTHTPGYMSRNDVCKDGRENCLVTYKLTDPVSVNKKPTKVVVPPDPWAPSATDVTAGLDAFGFLSSGNKNLDSREYISWYRPRPPRVAAPDTTKSASAANTQPVIYMDAFNLNGRPEGLTYFGGGQGLATIQFYAWAAHNQGPLRKITIDWGDGTVQTIDSAQLKNQKPLCNTERECEFAPGLACSSNADCPPAGGACVAMGSCKMRSYKECHTDQDCGTDDTCQTRMLFGNSNDACKQGYMEFSHVYTCKSDAIHDYLGDNKVCDKMGVCESNPDQSCADCRSDEKCVNEGLAPTAGCYNDKLDRCRYTPKIQVTDSWGWCSGNCSRDNEATPGGSPGAWPIRHPYGGCYDGSNTKFNTDVVNSPKTSQPLSNECDTLNTSSKFNRPWVVYKGSIEVAPATSAP